MVSSGAMKGNVNPTSTDTASAMDNPIGDDADAVALRLKKQARRRLIGAIALALFAVITLPMVMDSQPRPVAPEIQVHIPSQDGPGLTGKIVPGLAVKSTPMPTPTPAQKADVANAKDSTLKEPSPPVADAKTTSVKEGDLKLTADTAPAKTAQKTSPADTAPVDKAVATKTKPPAVRAAEASKKPADSAAPAPKSGDEPRALAALTGTESLSAPWNVQLGAYKEAGNVKVLVAKVKEMKLPVTTEKFESSQGPRVRVKAGPFATRADAEKAQARIRAIGVVGVLSQ